MKKWLIFSLVLGLSAFTARHASACSPVGEQVLVRCNNTLVKLHYGRGHGFKEQADAILSTLEGTCAESVADLKAVYYQEVINWSKEQEYFLPGGTTLVFEPYSPERESALLAEGQRHTYGDCGYPSIQRIGNWLKVATKMRSYCYQTGTLLAGPGSCGRVTFSETLFLWTAIRNINSATLPYLLLLLAIGVAFAAIVVYLAKRGQLLQ